jgi:hypothetical protein
LNALAQMPDSARAASHPNKRTSTPPSNAASIAASENMPTSGARSKA